MTVAELIEKLKEMPQDYDALIVDADSDACESYKMEIRELAQDDEISEVYISS